MEPIANISDLENGFDFVIVYDGECPVCARFFPTYLSLLNIGYRAKIVDARTNTDLTAWLLKERGIDIDRDAATLHQGHWYVGGEAIAVLTSLSLTKYRIINSAITRSLTFIYPTLRMGRLLLLKLLGRKLIHGRSQFR
ncbi:hypothetical protein U8P76_05840 [Rhizobium johnstonii]|nr:hypothetical protein U8P76_05840 [Rhizobium johnstonii]